MADYVFDTSENFDKDPHIGGDLRELALLSGLEYLWNNKLLQVKKLYIGKIDKEKEEIADITYYEIHELKKCIEFLEKRFGVKL